MTHAGAKYWGRGLFILLLCANILLSDSCKTSKKITGSPENLNQKERAQKTELLIKTARNFKGTPYKAGGEDKNGMDCSGLIFISFRKINLKLPRTSKDQSTIGNTIKEENAQLGDLIFFATNGKSKQINHVGITTSISHDHVLTFIHATLKAGVLEDNLTEPYYRNAFVKVKRVY